MTDRIAIEIDSVEFSALCGHRPVAHASVPGIVAALKAAPAPLRRQVGVEVYDMPKAIDEEWTGALEKEVIVARGQRDAAISRAEKAERDAATVREAAARGHTALTERLAEEASNLAEMRADRDHWQEAAVLAVVSDRDRLQRELDLTKDELRGTTKLLDRRAAEEKRLRSDRATADYAVRLGDLLLRDRAADIERLKRDLSEAREQLAEEHAPHQPATELAPGSQWEGDAVVDDTGVEVRVVDGPCPVLGIIHRRGTIGGPFIKDVIAVLRRAGMLPEAGPDTLEAQHLIGRLIDCIVLHHHMAAADWERACLLGGRFCSPFVGYVFTEERVPAERAVIAAARAPCPCWRTCS